MLYLPHSLHYFLDIMILCSKMIRSTKSCKNLLIFVQQSDLKELYQHIIIGQARKFYIVVDFLCFIIFWPPWIIYLLELRSLLYVYGIICSLSSKVWFPQRGACVFTAVAGCRCWYKIWQAVWADRQLFLFIEFCGNQWSSIIWPTSSLSEPIVHSVQRLWPAWPDWSTPSLRNWRSKLPNSLVP